MKNILLLLLFISSQLFSLTIVLNSAKQNGKPYAILHIEDKEGVDCQIVPQSLDKKIYLCKFDKVVKTPIKAKSVSLVSIDFLEKEKEFYIRIIPKVNSRLIPVKSSLYMHKEVSDKSTKSHYKHWMILLYEKSPFKENYVSETIDFPVMYPKESKPYVGALDVNGAPISYAQSKDIRLYLDIKKSYARKKYENVIEDSIDAVKKYPNTIFKSEFLLYRLKALDKGIEKNIDAITQNFESNDVVREGKAWTKSFPSDENIPEVEMLIAKAYLKMGSKADANYFMDILVSEHKDSPYTKKAILVFADSLYKTKNKAKARKLYRDVLYSAQDLDIAAEAAIRLGNAAIDRGKKNAAKQYLMKVLEANKDFIKKDRVKSYALATKLVEHGMYGVAAKIADVLLEGLKRHDETREKLLRDSGVWHAKANDVKVAYARLQQYLKEYKYGSYNDEVQASLDELFFQLHETNATKLVNYYDELIKKYDNKIGDKAVVEKAKLLLSQKKYKAVLKMKDKLEYVRDSNSTKKESELVTQAATALTKQALSDSKCEDVVSYIEKYQLQLDSFDKDLTFRCFIRTARYTKAKELSQKYIKADSLKHRLSWLQKYLLSEYKLHDYKSVISIGEDTLKLAKSLKIKMQYKTYEMMFFALMKSNKFEKALEIAKLLEKENPNKLTNADVFAEILKKAKDSRDDLLVTQYAQKIIKLQNRYKSYVYTPSVELSLIEALQRLKKIKDALGIAKGLLTKKITPQQKTRAYYNAGELSMKLNQNSEAKKYFQKCVKIKAKSSWKDICQQNLKLL